ncbi:hypothetical protein Aperf_G00000077331 [Anoplocephala perfoliata]
MAIQVEATNTMAGMLRCETVRSTVTALGGVSEFVRIFDLQNSKSREAALLALSNLVRENSVACKELVNTPEFMRHISEGLKDSESAALSTLEVIQELSRDDENHKKIKEYEVFRKISEVSSLPSERIQAKFLSVIPTLITSMDEIIQFQRMGGFENLFEGLKSAYSEIRHSATLSIGLLAENEFAASILYDMGVLKHLYAMQSSADQCSVLVDTAITNILDANLILKFAMTGTLDITGDLFYDVGPLNSSELLKPLSFYANEPLNDARPIWILNIGEVGTVNSEGLVLPYDTELRTFTKICINKIEETPNLMEKIRILSISERIQAKFLSVIPTLITSMDEIIQFQRMGGFENLFEGLKSAYSEIRHSATLSIGLLAENEFAASILYDMGVLKHLYAMQSSADQCSVLVDTAITNILDANLILKFAMTGTLDITGDLFYDVGPMNSSELLKPLSFYANEPLNDARPIWILNVGEVGTVNSEGLVLPYDTELRTFTKICINKIEETPNLMEKIRILSIVTPNDIHIKLTTDCASNNFDSPLCRGIKSLFRYDCLCGPPTPPSQHSNHYLFTKLFAHLIAGPKGIDELTCALKNFDYSDRCSLVWIGDYFAYRCRTCGLTPSMSLCGACFNAGNHENHDFNKFKSTCGGACDCGDPSVIKPSGNCRFHGPDKVANRPCPPRELIATLQFLLPSVMKALMFWFWDQCKAEEPSLNESEAPMLYFLHRLHACGWVTQQLMVDVMIDPEIFSDLVKDCSCTPAYRSYRASLVSRPQLYSKESDVNLTSTELKHTTLLESFLYTIVKLRFPESLCTLLIGLLPISDFKKLFIDAYVDHYETIASTLMITSRVRNISPEVAMQLNNRIVHISVQLFSGVNHALCMVKQKKLHYLIVKWMKNMLMMSRTRLDDRGKMVVNCDGVLIQNNAFWPLTSDLSNIISHKVVADVLVEDKEFLVLWTDILKLMQFMNCLSMKEGSHIEYETMACYHGLTMEIEVSISIMWYIWDHYRTSVS